MKKRFRPAPGASTIGNLRDLRKHNLWKWMYIEELDLELEYRHLMWET